MNVYDNSVTAMATCQACGKSEPLTWDKRAGFLPDGWFYSMTHSYARIVCSEECSEQDPA
jgi:hypothetical protein